MSAPYVGIIFLFCSKKRLNLHPKMIDTAYASTLPPSGGKATLHAATCKHKDLADVGCLYSATQWGKCSIEPIQNMQVRGACISSRKM